MANYLESPHTFVHSIASLILIHQDTNRMSESICSLAKMDVGAAVALYH